MKSPERKQCRIVGTRAQPKHKSKKSACHKKMKIKHKTKT